MIGTTPLGIECFVTVIRTCPPSNKRSTPPVPDVQPASGLPNDSGARRPVDGPRRCLAPDWSRPAMSGADVSCRLSRTPVGATLGGLGWPRGSRRGERALFERHAEDV